MKGINSIIFGPPEVLQMTDLEKPGLKDMDILIRVHATTVTSGAGI